MIFYFRAEVPDSADGRCDDADRRVADFLLQATSALISGNHPGHIDTADASADFGYGFPGWGARKFLVTGQPGPNAPLVAVGPFDGLSLAGAAQGELTRRGWLAVQVSGLDDAMSAELVGRAGR